MFLFDMTGEKKKASRWPSYIQGPMEEEKKTFPDDGIPFYYTLLLLNSFPLKKSYNLKK